MSVEIASNKPGPTAKTGLSLDRSIPRNIIWVVIYLFITSVFVLRAFSNWNYDDAYITYRYAANLSSGEGFVYNPGQRLLSTTTPLFTILLAAISFFWKDIPHAANVLGVLGISLGTLFLWDMCKQKNQRIAGYTCLALYPTFPLLVMTIGLETSLYIAFCLGAIAFYERRIYSLAAAFSALATLARPDGILVPLILVAHFVLTERSLPPFRPVLVYIILVLPWVLFSLLYFGSPVPVALVTKQNQGAMIVSERFSAGILTVLKPYSRRFIYIFELILSLTGLGSAILRRKTDWSILFTWTALYFLAYTILGVSRYHWYYAPLVPAFVVSIGLGISALVALMDRFFHTKNRFSTNLATVLILAMLGGGQIIHNLQIKRFPDQRREIYRAVGEWLSKNTLEDVLVGTLEVGIIGYYSQRPMLDFAGLLQPEIGSRLGPETSYADSALWATEKFHPRYLVLHDGLYPELAAGYAANNCQLVRQFKGEDYGYSRNLDIYKCQTPG